MPLENLARNKNKKCITPNHKIMTKEEFFEGFDPNDLETKRLLENSLNSRINLDDINKGISGNGTDPFEGIRTNKTFEEISNEIALSTPFGKSSGFYRQLREIINGQIPKL